MEKKDAEMLDVLAREVGKPIAEGAEPEVLEGESKKAALAAAERSANEYAYGGGGPVPGEKIDGYLDGLTKVSKKDAVDGLVAAAATLKARSEREAEEKKKKSGKRRTLTSAERARYRDDFVARAFYQQQEAYYLKYHYLMDGHTKRKTRKIIERAFDKGKYDKYLVGGGLNE